MSSVELTFDTPGAVVLETDENAGPVLAGRAVAFGVSSGPSSTDGRRYRFTGPPDNGMVGALAVREHDDFTPIGTVASEETDASGLSVRVPLLDTTAGRDSRAEARAGVRNGFSVSFDPIETSEAEDGVIDVVRWTVRHLGHVMHPAFGERTQAIAASTKEPVAMPDTATTDPAPTAQLAERLDQLEARLTAPPPAPPRHLSVREGFALQLTASKGSSRVLALADVISSGNSGVLPMQWSSEVRNTFDSYRYFIPRLGQVPFPTAGYTLAIPKVVQQTLVAARGAEKTDIPSRALTTGQDIYTATWYAGGVDIALELVYQSDPAIVGLVVDNLFQQYAAVTDTAVTLAMEAAATATGSVLDFTSYGAFVGKVMAASELIRAATGRPGDMLALTPASWGKLIALTDAQGRRILSSGNGVNSDGSADLLATEVNVGGITCFLNARATKDLQYNKFAARVAEKPPLELTDVNVSKAGQDVGVLGAVMDLPLYPNGIKRHAATTELEADTATTSRKK